MGYFDNLKRKEQDNMDINTIFEWIKWLGIWILAGALAVATAILIFWAFTHFMWKRPAAKKAVGKAARGSEADASEKVTTIIARVKPGQSAGVRPVADFVGEEKITPKKDFTVKDGVRDESKNSDSAKSAEKKFFGVTMNFKTISTMLSIVGILIGIMLYAGVKPDQQILLVTIILSLIVVVFTIKKAVKMTSGLIKNIVRFAGISVFTLMLMVIPAGIVWVTASSVPNIVIKDWMIYVYVVAWIMLYLRTWKFSSKDYVKPGHIGVPRLFGWTIPIEMGPGPYAWFGTVTETANVAMVANLFGHYKDGSDSNGMEVTVGGPSVIAGVKGDDAIAGLKDSKIIALLKAAVSWHIVDHHKAQRVLGIKDWENFEWNEETENNLFKKILPQILTHIRAVVASYPFDKIVAENSEAVRRVNDTTKVDPSEEKSSLYLVNEFAKENFGIEVLKISFTKILAKDQAITDLMAGPSVEEMQRAKERADAETATKLIETVTSRLGYADKTFAQLTQFQQTQVLDVAGKSKGEAGGKSEGITGAALIAAAEAFGKGVAGILGGEKK